MDNNNKLKIAACIGGTVVLGCAVYWISRKVTSSVIAPKSKVASNVAATEPVTSSPPRAASNSSAELTSPMSSPSVSQVSILF